MAAEDQVEARIQPSRGALAEALLLAEEILKNLELGELGLAKIALRTSRLARLLNDFEIQKIMEYEASGYPSSSGTIPTEVWRLVLRAGRNYHHKDYGAQSSKEVAYTESIEALESEIRAAELVLSKITDIPQEKANPWSPVPIFDKASLQRGAQLQSLRTATDRLASRRAFIYNYAAGRYYELKFSGIASDVFSRVTERVDRHIAQLIPDAVKRFTAVYENLQSENPEDWSNAAHGCRRILLDLADAVFPPTEVRTVKVDGREKEIKLGKSNYINRIVAYIQDNASSARFEQIVGSHIGFIGDRLDAVVTTAQKGSHETILTREEADRLVVYTYMIVGDILSLRRKNDV